MAHILLIDDDEDFRSMLKQMLEHDGHRVQIAADGEEGLRRAAESQPELIITDILMPKKDGIETIMALARQGSEVPIIAISGGRRAITAEFNLNSASLMGVKATLPKPFTRDQLRRTIKEAFGAKA